MGFIGLADIGLVYRVQGVDCVTLRTFDVDTALLYPENGAILAEAWWNSMKADWRATQSSYVGAIFQRVTFKAITGTPIIGEYAIPIGEQDGTRTYFPVTEPLPPFISAGVRLSVGLSTTRPGSMRVSGGIEGDMVTRVWTPEYRALVGALAARYSTSVNIDYGILAGTAVPVVTHKSPAPPHGVLTYQPVTGFEVATRVTTQNTRKS